MSNDTSAASQDATQRRGSEVACLREERETLFSLLDQLVQVVAQSSRRGVPRKPIIERTSEAATQFELIVPEARAATRAVDARNKRSRNRARRIANLGIASSGAKRR